jgi:hypothetical protein
VLAGEPVERRLHDRRDLLVAAADDRRVVGRAGVIGTTGTLASRATSMKPVRPSKSIRLRSRQGRKTS